VRNLRRGGAARHFADGAIRQRDLNGVHAAVCSPVETNSLLAQAGAVKARAEAREYAQSFQEMFRLRANSGFSSRSAREIADHDFLFTDYRKSLRKCHRAGERRVELNATFAFLKSLLGVPERHHSQVRGIRTLHAQDEKRLESLALVHEGSRGFERMDEIIELAGLNCKLGNACVHDGLLRLRRLSLGCRRV
jgi:hypothetical protein